MFLVLFVLLIKLTVFSLAVPFGGNFHPGLANLEGYQDFRLAYVPMVSNFTAGKMPYRDFNYAYPPFFLYLLTPFAFFSLPFWAMALPLVIFDAASVILVFLICLKLMTSNEAFMAAIVFAVAPINLWYNDFLWLNPPPMTFFILLAIYALLSKKYRSSFICLAIATLFKQIAFALFPIFIVTLLNKADRREVAKNALLYGTICFVGSLPYIVTIPTYYLWSLGVPGFSVGWPSTPFTYYFGSPTNLAIVFGENAYDPAKPFLWAALLLSFAVLCWRIIKTKKINDTDFVAYVLYALLLFHAFFPRGIYKYYYAAVTPFDSMFVKSRRAAVIFFGLNALMLAVPRLLTPWLIVLLLILSLRREMNSGRFEEI